MHNEFHINLSPVLERNVLIDEGIREIFALHDQIYPKQEDSYEKQFDILLSKAKKTTVVINESETLILQTSDNLKRTREEAEVVLNEIQSLLPKASTSGLAAIYQEKIKEISKPKIGWLFLIILSCVALSAVGAWFIYELISKVTPFWEMITGKIIIALPIIWFLFFSATRYMSLVELERAYAHKEEVGRVFIGFKHYLDGRTTENPKDTEMTKSVNKLTEGLVASFLEKIEAVDIKKVPKILSVVGIGNLKKLTLKQGNSNLEIDCSDHEEGDVKT